MNYYGICEWSLPVSGATAIKLAGSMGFNGIQLGEAGGAASSFPLGNKRVREAYLEAAEESGIAFQALNLGALLGSGFMKFAPSSPKGELARLSLTKGFDAAEALGIPVIVITFESDDCDSFENSISHLKYAEELSRRTGVRIAIETGQCLQDIERMLERTDERDKICMDLLNPLRFGTGDPREQIRYFGGDRIDHFHFKDSISSLFIKGQRGCVLLGTGDADLKSSCEIIKSMGFEGWMVSENYYFLPPMNDGSIDFCQLAETDLRTMKTLI